jgi:16S rRNA (adenine1518-N6/adenine1519-N6)-dimethyltransferase
MKGHIARKRFGQNFLIDQGVINGIVSAIDPRAGDTVVEIGPGLGALTVPLVQRMSQFQQPLHVVEIDRDLIARLKKQYTREQLVIHEGDALAFDFAPLAPLGSKLRIAGNLPYNISTPLLFHLATYANRVHDMHFMLQKEVVERMVAEPGNSEFSRISVMLQYRFAMEWLLDVPPESFDPPPRVESAVVRLMPLPADQLQAKDEALFAKVVLTAFSQRRKMLRNNLKGLLGDEGFADLGLVPTLRAEDVPVSDYVRIANYLSEKQA